MRHVITIDGAFLSSIYAGTSFVATMFNGNSNTYIITVCIRDSENKESWEWFFSKLSCAIGEIVDLVIILDRHLSITEVIPRVFINVLHGYYAFHRS